METPFIFGSIAIPKEKDLRICHLDLFNVRDEEHFYQLLAQEIIKATSSKWDDAIENVRKFFKKVIPKIALANFFQKKFRSHWQLHNEKIFRNQ